MGTLATSASSVVPSFLDDEAEHRRQLASVLNGVMQGKLNIRSTVTLKSAAVSTTVSDARCSVNSIILLMPTSANGGIALSPWSVRTRSAGSFVITHVSTSTSDCTADYVIFA